MNIKVKNNLIKLLLTLFCLSFIFCLVLLINQNAVYASADNSEERTVLNTKSYVLSDNSGYIPKGQEKSAFGNKPYAEISLWYNGGTIMQGNDINGTASYGYIAGGELNEDNTVDFSVRLKYNYPSTKNLGEKNWEISDDSWKGAVNKINGVGVVGTGALLVQKSYTGGKNATEWQWENQYIKNGKTSSFHTVDFTTHYLPEHYDGKSHEWTNGDKSYSSDGYVTVYRPDGQDLKKGVYIKVLFAYEIKYSTTYRTWYTLGIGTATEWHYANVVEETTFYVSNGAADVLFQNVSLTEVDSRAEKPTDDETLARTEMVQMAGTILDGHATNEGFRINTNGYETYKIEYKKDDSTNWVKTTDGTLFSKPGKYTFRVISDIGKEKITTIYINETGTNNNIKFYFSDGFITKDSERLYEDEVVPVYRAGNTRYKIAAIDDCHMPLVGSIRRITGQEIETITPDDPRYDAEKGGEQEVVNDIYEEVAILSAEQSRKGFDGVLTESGEYVAEFYNNPDYDGAVSGDYYHFVFKFILADEDSVPSLNQTLLDNNLCFFNYAAGYYGVTLKLEGGGTVTYAYPDYSSAFDFAYNYYLKTVDVDNDKYIFDGEIYSQVDALKAVTKAAESLVERKYFDATDKNTYLTVQDAAVNILAQELEYDVIVLSDMFSSYNAKCGESFLNDKVLYYISSKGQLVETKQPIRFISVAGFESSSVKLYYENNEGGLLSYSIEYGVPIEATLRALNAPSGRYKIVEENAYGHENVYYGVYIRQGDIRTNLIIKRTLNGITDNPVLSHSNINASFTANNFVLVSASNDLDPYGIVKVQKQGKNGYTKIYELSEVKNIAFDDSGKYLITLSDRLGNTAEFNINIYSAKKISTLTLINRGAEFDIISVSGGQNVKLPVLNSDDKDIEFIGWIDDRGNIFKETFQCEYEEDFSLTALWRYAETKIELYDGRLIDSITAKPAEIVQLPDLQNGNLSLYGFAYQQSDDKIRFYRGQITNVPDVTFVRLDAVWVDYSQTYEGIEPVRAGMKFYGWLNQTDGLTGSILKSEEIENGMTVYSLWLTDPNSAIANPVSAVSSSMKDSGNFFDGTTGIFGAVGALIITSAFIAAILCIVAKLRRKDNKNSNRTRNNINVVNNAQQATACGNNDKVKLPFKYWIKRHIIAIIAIFMSAVFAFTCLFKLLYPISQQKAYDNYIANIKSMLLEQTNVKRAPAESYPAAIYEAGIIDNEQKTSDEFTEEETFLLAHVYIDLMSLDYDVFPATVTKQDGTEVKGFGYCDYNDIYEKEGTDKLYVGCGFVSIFGEPLICDDDTKDGLELCPILADGEELPEYGLIVSFEETFGPIHYIAYERYLTYTVKNFRIEYRSVENDPSVYNLELGYLYDYDLEQPIYDPDLGMVSVYEPDAYSLVQGIDYDYALAAGKASIEQQNDNFLTVDSMQVVYISREAINEYILHGQDESYLGVPADQLQYLESNLEDNLYYYIDADGEVQLAEIPPDPEPNIFSIIMSIVQITLGAILIVTGVGAATGAMMIAGGIIGLVSDKLSAILGGLGTIGNGLKCLMIGIQVFTACAPLGAIVGTGMIITGAATMAFGANDIITAVTGRNFIQEITGMSDKAYFWTSLGLNIASTVLSVVGAKGLQKGAFCFAAGTAVLTVGVGGKVVKKAIEDVKVGDRVMSYNEETGNTEVKTVTATFTSEHEETVKVKDVNGQEIVSSLGHNYYTQNRGWIAAENLRAGDILQTVKGETVIVEQVQHEIAEHSQTLYNFAVDGNHNYYVADSIDSPTSDFVLVHNRGCNGFSKDPSARNTTKLRFENGKITHAATYDDAGNIIARFDFIGKSHGGIATPHVHWAQYNQFGRCGKGVLPLAEYIAKFLK